MARVDPYKNLRFLVEIDGVIQAGFSDCTGFGSHVEPVEYREGGEPNAVRKLPGKVTYPDITLKWGVTDSRELYDGHLAALNGQLFVNTVPSSFRTILGRRRYAGTSSMRGRPSGRGQRSAPKATTSQLIP